MKPNRLLFFFRPDSTKLLIFPADMFKNKTLLISLLVFALLGVAGSFFGIANSSNRWHRRGQAGDHQSGFGMTREVADQLIEKI